MDNGSFSVAAYTLGCKVNFYETEAILAQFRERGFNVVEFGEKADVYIVNTCSVTNVSAKKSRQTLNRAKGLNPCAITAVVGCHAQMAPNEFEGVADIIIGTRDKLAVVNAAEERIKGGAGAAMRVLDVSRERFYEPMSVKNYAERSRAFVKIQDGCDMFCSYCVIPYARGRARSRDFDDICAELRVLAENGFKEIVLTGIHLASYGKDLYGGKTLCDVLTETAKIKGIERVRLSSLEPVAIDGDFIGVLRQNPKICPHFHLPLQSGCDKTLKMMNRQYTSRQFAQSAHMLRGAFDAVSITTDIIVGFPQESGGDFEESRRFAETMGFMKIHVFPFSAKIGTRAASLDGAVTKAVKSERAAQMTALSNASAQAFCGTLVGKTARVLAERAENGTLFGYSEHYAPVRIRAHHSGKGDIIDVVLKNFEADGVFNADELD